MPDEMKVVSTKESNYRATSDNVLTISLQKVFLMLFLLRKGPANGGPIRNLRNSSVPYQAIFKCRSTSRPGFPKQSLEPLGHLIPLDPFIILNL